MTNEDIIRMAREAQQERLSLDGRSPSTALSGHWFSMEVADLARFAALVRAAEREACAKVCEDEAEKWEGDDGPISTEARLCAINIRARGEK